MGPWRVMCPLFPRSRSHLRRCRRHPHTAEVMLMRNLQQATTRSIQRPAATVAQLRCGTSLAQKLHQRTILGGLRYGERLSRAACHLGSTQIDFRALFVSLTNLFCPFSETAKHSNIRSRGGKQSVFSATGGQTRTVTIEGSIFIGAVT